MSAAHGGQVLLLASRGRHARRAPARRRRAARPRLGAPARSGPCEHVFQLVHPSLRRDFPALRSLEATPNNLPQQLTSFVGREGVLAHIKELLCAIEAA